MSRRSRSSMRVTVIWPYYPPELGGASNRGAALVEALLRAGHEVTLVTPRPSYFLPWHAKSRQPQGGKYRESRLGTADASGISASAGSRDLHTIRLPVGLRPKSKRRSLRVAREILGSLTLPVWASRAIARSDLVVTSTPPLSFGFLGVVLARALGRRVVLDVRDRWPDVLVEAGKVSPSSPLVAAASAMSLTAYRLATLITAVTERDVDVLVSQGAPRDKVLLAVNGVENQVLRMGADSSEKPTQFRIVYAGLLGPAQGVEVLFDALQRADLPLRVDVVGTGSEEPTLASYAERLLCEVRFHGALGREDCLAIMKRAHAAFVPLASSEMRGTVPSKLFEAMALGLPVLAVASGEAASLVSSAGAGLVSEPGDAEALAENVRRLYYDRAYAAEMGARGREWVAKKFIREEIFAELLSKIERRLEAA